MTLILTLTLILTALTTLTLILTLMVQELSNCDTHQLLNLMENAEDARNQGKHHDLYIHCTRIIMTSRIRFMIYITIYILLLYYITLLGAGNDAYAKKNFIDAFHAYSAGCHLLQVIHVYIYIYILCNAYRVPPTTTV